MTIPTARLAALEPPHVTPDELEALAYDTTMRGTACHIDMGDPHRDVLRSGDRIIAWASKGAAA